MKILVIDDDPLSLSGLKMALEQRGGHQCSTFGDPEEAFEAWMNFDFDVIISDVRMPKMTGLDLMEAVHRIRPDFPIILMTGFRDSLTEAAAATHGAQAFFLKPLRTEQLLATLKRIEQSRTL